jgi:PAS domain S-box-containing protein
MNSSAQFLTTPLTGSADLNMSRLDADVGDGHSAFLQHILDSSTEYSVIGKDLDGNILLWNEGSQRIYGYAPEEVVGKANAAILHTPEDVAAGKPQEIMSAALKDGKWEGTINRLRKNGEQFVARVVLTPRRDAADKVIGFLLISKDISDEIRQQVLQESEERFRTMANSIPQLACIAQADGYIYWFNQRWYEYTGTTLEQMEGWGWQSVHDPLMLPKVLEQWRASIATGDRFDMEFPLRGGDGVFRPFLTRMLPLKDAEGHVVQWVGTNTDITERQRAEEDIRQLNAELEHRVIERTAQLQANNIRLNTEIGERKQAEEELKVLNETLEQRVQERTVQAEAANRMKSEFLANMSHELRTPLNGIIGFAEFLADGKPGGVNPKQKEYLEDILNSGKHLLQLINDVLDLAKVEAGKMELNPEKFSLGKAIEEVCAVTKPIVQKKGIRLEVNVAPEVGYVTLDQQKFKQVLYNLLSNAVKFTDDGSKVEIRVAMYDAYRFKLLVQDTGIGIKTKDLPRLFKEFEQLGSGVARRREGTGLGLALTRKIVELHGGTIGVESEFGKGSSFTVVLPLVTAKVNV